MSSIILNGNALNVSSETINERLKEYYKRQLLEKKKTIMKKRKKREHARNRYRNLSDDKKEKLILEITTSS